MKRILLIAAIATAASGVAATPAVVGLVGNPSFSHDIPVRVPDTAKSPELPAVENGGDHSSPVTSIAPALTRSPEPSDTKGEDSPAPAATHDDPSAEPTEDNPSSEPTESGDDHGGATATVSRQDDATGTHSESPSPEPSRTESGQTGTSDGSGSRDSSTSGSSLGSDG